MARARKQGLDYFPVDTNLMQNRSVRRIMKQEGDGAFTVLLSTLSYIYKEEGYYIHADSLFYLDLATDFYEKNAEDVARIIRLAVKYELFNASLFEEYSILTSADIQRQYLTSTKRRKTSRIENDYCLLSDEELIHLQAKRGYAISKRITGKTDKENEVKVQNVTIIPQNVTSGTHSIAQNSIAKHSVAKNSKEFPLSVPPKGKVERKEERIYRKRLIDIRYHTYESFYQPPQKVTGMPYNSSG